MVATHLAGQGCWVHSRSHFALLCTNTLYFITEDESSGGGGSSAGLAVGVAVAVVLVLAAVVMAVVILLWARCVCALSYC